MMLRDLWYRAVLHSATGVYYRHVTLVGAERLPARGPVLYVGLHRNGAVDGMLYKRLFPRATFLIAKQLVRSALGRIFFNGIPVTREHDAQDGASRRENAASIARCVDQLARGGELFVLPEGTSDLGPRHLPFRSGAAQILARALAAAAPVQVVPLAIFYDAPEGFRSDVCVVAGAPVPTAIAAGLSERRRVEVLMERLTSALEALGVNVESAATLSRVETMAALATGGADAGATHHRALKALERAPVPPLVEDAWMRLVAGVVARRVRTHRGVPVYSRRGITWNAAWVMVQAFGVAAGAVANLPVIAAAYLAGRRLADARNTIALWRLLAGAPLAATWFGVVAGLAWTLHRPGLLIAYVIASVLGLVLYPELCARWPRLWNAMHGDPGRDDAEVIAHWVSSLGVAQVERFAVPRAVVRIERAGRRHVH